MSPGGKDVDTSNKECSEIETSMPMDADGARNWNFPMVKKYFGLTGSSAVAHQGLSAEEE